MIASLLLNIFTLVFCILLFSLQLNCQPISSLSTLDRRGIKEIDISWDFEENEKVSSGWGNATSEQMDMEVTIGGGELRCSIKGPNPRIESPNLLLQVGSLHYVIIRAKYQGPAENAILLIRSGSQSSPDQQLLMNKEYWSERMSMSVISGTGSFDGLHGMNMLADQDDRTYFLSSRSTVAYVVFDLKDVRWINTVRVLTAGDKSSPRNCLLQQSASSGVGPFKTVRSFTLDKVLIVKGTMVNQVIKGFDGYARYWRIVFLDNHGDPNHIGIREVYLDGYDDSVTVVPFALDNSGTYKLYYLRISQYLAGIILKMRLELIYTNNNSSNPIAGANFFREGLSIDYIRIARAPEIWRVRGCLDLYYSDSNYNNAEYNVTTVVEVINNNLPIYSFIDHNMTSPYATTYDCPLGGGVPITIEGVNFGPHANVFIGNKNCPLLSISYDEVNGRNQKIVCMLPPGVSGKQSVRVENAVHPGLFHEIHSLFYRVAPPVPDRPVVTNIGACRVDLTWSVPGEVFDQMTVTGYKVVWFQPKFRSRVSNLTVGNVTTTSVKGLEPGTEYVFSIAAITEGHTNANLPTDQYGRRQHLSGGLLGEFSIDTNITGTLYNDFDFSFFSANQTLNSSGSSPSVSLGPTGQFGSEGQYGLVIVGSANIQNCNVSSTCCDGYNSSIGISSCGSYRSVCAVLPAEMLAYNFALDGVTRRGVPSNLPYANGATAEINIVTLDELISKKGADLPSSACGPALRLTNSEARQSGSSWYRRKVNVREGFDTYIKFQISNPSQKCDRLDDVNTYCRSRGADGIAFVIQNAAPDALGKAGSGLGYEGIFNSLAVEMDTYHNYEQMDYYENHISVLTQGFRYNITANHSRSLATTTRIPDLTDGIHTIRIKYDPNFDTEAVLHPSFQVNGFASWFMNNADFANGGEGDWGTGFGLFYVYLDDMYSPVITTPMNLGATLDLDNGRAYIGLTAATGDSYWQAHDILSWQFSSLFIDEIYNPPLVINNSGAHQCVNESVCVHQVDYDHYMRTNNKWGKGADTTEGWQTGTEGYCTFC